MEFGKINDPAVIGPDLEWDPPAGLPPSGWVQVKRSIPKEQGGGGSRATCPDGCRVHQSSLTLVEVLVKRSRWIMP